MGKIIKANGNKIAYGIKDLIIDTDEELNSLNKKTLTPGTKVFSIASSRSFMLTTNREWKEVLLGANNTTTTDLDAGSID